MDERGILESILQFTHSPMWRTPVDNFIDERCALFTDDEEMKVEQTEVHMQFRKITDDILSKYVKELGITLEDALNAVVNSMDTASQTNRLGKKFMQEIFYIEDFPTFHKMMVRRNIELDILAQCEISQKRENSGAKTANDEEEAMRLAIEASLNDEEKTRRLMELEDLQLQEALALSIAAEHERARNTFEKISQEAVEEAKVVGKAAAEETKLKKLTAAEEEKEKTIVKLEERALEVRQQAMLQRLTATMVVEPTPVAPKKEAPAPAPAKAPAESKPAATAAKAPTAPPAVPPGPLSRGRPIMPSLHTDHGADSGKKFGFSKLPTHQPSFKQLEATMAKGIAGASSAGGGAAGAGAASSKVEDEELARRAEHMRKQRELILQKNRETREEELRNYMNTKTTNPADSSVGRVERHMTLDLAQRLRNDILDETKK
ncbi:hypothetical protein, conserved [Trypanosoma brucei gambiense DAL972]|uniref:Cilia- and flagella-associated protein 36 n=1 Tax=Trypanosoma brucei gambiense (strain MHOM/CI/86/DAL972) TaxID=679716 RepID=D0A2X6_TRYB9|nr:hypothetical protein, conserved [Trypanosoma brucei gambiense DAL972]CBH15620.1 hypothetical protein, conserved [Trypanosoma brucei gambiense DAL972]|eukprot:XP_011777884.1 hypothetical protein, conserved [Trypanosoma brucei gambiense DAL972]